MEENKKLSINNYTFKKLRSRHFRVCKIDYSNNGKTKNIYSIMKKIKYTCSFLILVTQISCNLNYSSYSFSHDVTKVIAGKNYNLLTIGKTKSINIFGAKDNDIECFVNFSGFASPIYKEINEDDFNKKLGDAKFSSFKVDSVSFTMNDSKSKIELDYYLSLHDDKRQITFTLTNNDQEWELY